MPLKVRDAADDDEHKEPRESEFSRMSRLRAFRMDFLMIAAFNCKFDFSLRLDGEENLSQLQDSISQQSASSRALAIMTCRGSTTNRHRIVHLSL